MKYFQKIFHKIFSGRVTKKIGCLVTVDKTIAGSVMRLISSENSLAKRAYIAYEGVRKLSREKREKGGMLLRKMRTNYF